MLSRPDFLEKQLVVITAGELKGLALKNDNLVVYQDEKLVDQLPCSKIFSVFVIGDCTITTKLIGRLQKYQISLYLFSQSLYPRSIIGSQLEGNYLLRSKQYKQTKEEQLSIAKQLVKNKIANQGKLLKELRGKSDECKKAISKIADLYEDVDKVLQDDILRGMEGHAGKLFFRNYFDEMGWYRRAPRTKEDIINVLLDIGYTYLYRFIEAQLDLYGFDVYKGVYHKLFYERKSLVCDLVEPWRCIMEKKIRKMYNLGQVKEKDFGCKQGKYFFKNRKISRKYTKLLLEEVINYKMEMFDYVKSYYMAYMKEERELPVFYIDGS